jgi:hypothetical protein
MPFLYSKMMRSSGWRISRAHEAINNKLPESAEDSFNKNRARGVGWKRQKKS